MNSLTLARRKSPNSIVALPRHLAVGISSSPCERRCERVVYAMDRKSGSWIRCRGFAGSMRCTLRRLLSRRLIHRSMTSSVTIAMISGALLEIVKSLALLQQQGLSDNGDKHAIVWFALQVADILGPISTFRNGNFQYSDGEQGRLWRIDTQLSGQQRKTMPIPWNFLSRPILSKAATTSQHSFWTHFRHHPLIRKRPHQIRKLINWCRQHRGQVLKIRFIWRAGVASCRGNLLRPHEFIGKLLALFS